MSCFPCLRRRKRESSSSRIDDGCSSEIRNSVKPPMRGEKGNAARSFTFRELAVATQNFNEANLLGEGGFGKVYKGRVLSNQAVAIKQLNRDGLQGNQEFLVEVLMLIVLRHANLVSLIGYCTDGDERLLIYEYMPKGSLEDHLFDPPGKPPLDWNTRIKIVLGVAKGLTYLHDVANPPVIYRDMKAANVLLDDDFNPKLSDFGLAKLGPVGDNTHVSTRVMGTYGYCAPDYAMSGKLTLKSDVYSFGVLLLELITGRRVYDSSKPTSEQKLLTWCITMEDYDEKFLCQDLSLTIEGSFTSWPILCFRADTRRGPFTSWLSSPQCVFKSNLMFDPSLLMWLLLSIMLHLSHTSPSPSPRRLAPSHHHHLQLRHREITMAEEA